MSTNRNKGVTLTELLVSCILIGIVMIGVASFSVSVQQLHSSTNRSTLLSIRTMTAMNRMSKSAFSAVGDNTNMGIVPNGGNTSICFRLDTNDPSSYSDDTWDCFWADGSNDLYACGPNATPPINNAAACQQPAGSAIKMVSLVGSNFFQLMSDGNGRLETVRFQFTSIFDPTEAAHPVSNPTYDALTDISPPGHSR